MGFEVINKFVWTISDVIRFQENKYCLPIWAVLLAALLVTGCAQTEKPAIDETSAPEKITTSSGLIYEIISPGSGPLAKAGDTAMIHEITTLRNGTVVTDTWAMNFPISFLLGGKQVIDGLDEAVTGMRVGERRKLIVPPSLSKRSSYPENGLFGPADTLYYDVILLKVSPQ